MLKIDKGEPWVMWPDNLVSNFIESPANKIFDYDGEYIFNLKFELNEPIDGKKTLIAKLPTYFGIDIIPNGCLLIYSFQDGIEAFQLFKEYKWNQNLVYDLVVKKNGNQMSITINEEEFFHIELNEQLGYDDNSHIIFGAGNFPKNGFNLNYLSLTLHYLNIVKDGKVISEHKFETFIHEKSFDLSNNCNFLHKI